MHIPRCGYLKGDVLLGQRRRVFQVEELQELQELQEEAKWV